MLTMNVQKSVVRRASAERIAVIFAVFGVLKNVTVTRSLWAVSTSARALSASIWCTEILRSTFNGDL